jgi:hypothetical protein
MGNDVLICRSYLRSIKRAGTNSRHQISRRRLQMHARNIQIRAALLAVIALAIIAAFSTGASAATRPECTINPYTVAGRSCIELQASQAARHAAAKKSQHKVTKKHRSKQCLTNNPYQRYMHCR